MLAARRSPKRATAVAVFDKLVAFPSLLSHPNLTIEGLQHAAGAARASGAPAAVYGERLRYSPMPGRAAAETLWGGRGGRAGTPVLGVKGADMMTMDHVLHGHRAVTVGVLGVAALLAVGVWGVVNLVEGDWFIGGVFVACALLGVPSLISTVRRMRREERRSATPASRRPG